KMAVEKTLPKIVKKEMKKSHNTTTKNKITNNKSLSSSPQGVNGQRSSRTLPKNGKARGDRRTPPQHRPSGRGRGRGRGSQRARGGGRGTIRGRDRGRTTQ